MTILKPASQPEIRRYFVRTPEGDVSLVSGSIHSVEPVIFIHGAARNSAKLAKWVTPGSALLELPGHGVAPFISGNIEKWRAAFQHAIETVWPSKNITLVGESLGGILALGMKAARTIAIDPPMQPTEAVEHEIQHGNVAEFLRPMLRASYWDLLDRLEKKVEIVCATEGILPIVARERLRTHAMVEFHEISGGHLLLDENSDEIAEMLGRK